MSRAPHKPSVLIADDHDDSREALALFLRLRGHEVRCAHGGVEAIALATSFPPDIVLLDIQMPRADGYEVCSALRRSKTAGGARICAVSALSGADYRLRCKQTGFDDQFSKPLDFARLSEMLDSISDCQSTH